MDVLSKAIRDDPYTYMPEKSLSVFWYFRKGYDTRRAMEGRPYGWQDGPDGAFAQWIRQRFGVRAKALSHLAVISSFCLTEADAFSKYFELLEEYCAVNPAAPPISGPRMDNKSFLDIIRGIRGYPVHFIGTSSFMGSCSFLMGESRAHHDLNLPMDENRHLFESFKRWVEENKNLAQPRPWFKIVCFWSGGVDCGHIRTGAFALFSKWLDEYAAQVGRPGLFECTGMSKPDPSE
jgi:hypothetical protein